MALTFVPILAQALAIGVGDRSELRYRAEFEPDASADAWEAETRPYTSLELSGRRASIGVGYSPSFIYAPLEDDPELTVLHAGSAFANLVLRSRYTSVTFEERADYLQENLTLQALSPPRLDVSTPPADMMPGAGDPGGAGPDGADAPAEPQERASRETVQQGSVRSEVSVSHRASRKTTLDGSLGYAIRGGLDATSREVYPVEYGPDAELSLSYRANRRDTLVTSLGGRMTLTPAGQRALSVGARQGLSHRFNKRTVGDVGAGVTYTRTEPLDTPAIDAWYPTGGAGLEYWTLLEGGTLTLRLTSDFSPVVDQSTIRFDPRLHSSAGVSYSRRRLTAFATATSAFSLQPDAPQALNSFGANAGVTHQTTTRLTLYSYADGGYSARPDGAQRLDSLGVGGGAAYAIGAGFSAETGVRSAYRQFETEQIVPASFAAFVALSWSAMLPASRQTSASARQPGAGAGQMGAGQMGAGASLAPARAKP